MGAGSEFAAGVGLLGRGLGLVARRPRLFVLGALPPLVTSVLFTAVLVVLAVQLDDLVGWLTPFAGPWAPGLALLAAAALLMVITFVALTLALGSPLYDLISESVDRELTAGEARQPGRRPAPADEPLVRSLARTVRQSLALVSVSALGAVLLFAAGFVPVLGQVVVPVVSAVFGGWLLGIELVGSTFERAGLLRLTDRRQAMRRRRARVLGLTVPTFLLLAVPFVAVLVFPAATAAGTILARDLLRTTGPASPAPVRG